MLSVLDLFQLCVPFRDDSHYLFPLLQEVDFLDDIPALLRAEWAPQDKFVAYSGRRFLVRSDGAQIPRAFFSHLQCHVARIFAASFRMATNWFRFEG